MSDENRRFYGVQFHPEVTHTKKGLELLMNFVVNICGCETKWTAENIIEDAVVSIKEQVGDDEVILGLSGGVASSVVALLLHRADVYKRQVSGSISLPSPGFFSPFLHSTGSLSVNQEYLALEDGPPIFKQDITCPALLVVSLVP